MKSNEMRSMLCAFVGTAGVVTTGAMWRSGAAYTHLPIHVPAAQLKRDAVTFAPAGIRGSAPPV